MATNPHGRLSATAAAALVALAVAAPAVSANPPEVSRTDAVVAQVAWGTGDVDTGAGSWGGLAAYQQPDADGISYWQEDTEAVVCDAGTASPADDYAGLAGTLTIGEGSIGVVEIAPNLRSASASGTLRIETVSYDACAAEWTLIDSRPAVAVTLELVATGKSETDVHVYRDGEAGVYTQKGVSQVGGYWATGSATIDGLPLDFDAGFISHHRGHDRMKFLG